MAPVVINDTLTQKGEPLSKIQLPVEFYLTADGKMTYMVTRSAATNIRSFSEEFVNFVVQNGFANVAILTSTGSPVARERTSNRQIPEIFAYCNNYLFNTQPDYYNKNGVRKWGFWIQDVKKRPH